MPQNSKNGVSMEKLRELLRLSLQQKLSNRDIAARLRISHTTVAEYLKRLPPEWCEYPKIEELTDTQLQQKLRNQKGRKKQDRPMPDFEWMHKELQKKHVTLQLLWMEYQAIHPDGYQSSQFYDLYRIWSKKLDYSLRMTHTGGDKVFVDFCGTTINFHDPQSGRKIDAQIFVAVLGASKYTFAVAVSSQQLEHWIEANVRMLEFFGGCPQAIVIDNLKAGVTRASRYEPEINRIYEEFSRYYQTTILPTRVRAPKDKALAENGVLIVSRWIIAALRNRQFFSLHELNQAISELLERINNRPFHKMESTRKILFEELDHPALMPLPAARYEFASWKKARVNIDYHVEFDKCYYSVPYRFLREQVWIRCTPGTVEIFLNNQSIAVHPRLKKAYQHNTHAEHMPTEHREYLQWTPTRLLSWAETIGLCTRQIIQNQLERKRHPEQGYRSCLGILRLSRRYSPQRLEQACARALFYQTNSVRSIRLILEKGLDQQNPTPTDNSPGVNNHPNLRGTTNILH